jgi:hypothetical protein
LGSDDSDDDTSYNMRFNKKGKATFGDKQKPNEWEVKFLKQIELSQNDAEVIEQQQKKIWMQKLEMEEFMKKYNRLDK